MRRDAMSAAWPLAIAARTVLAVLIPTGLAQLRVAKSAVFAEDLIVLDVFPTNFVALQRIEKRRLPGSHHLVLGSHTWRTRRGRHADTTGTFHR
jgi:hypothetical protein